MGKENASWNALCGLTTELKEECGSRPNAFREACRRRPDLAADAIDPTGKPVAPRAKGAKPTAVGTAPKSFEEAMVAANQNPLVKACERLAQTGRAE
jgi:hypothetical protein